MKKLLPRLTLAVLLLGRIALAQTPQQPQGPQTAVPAATKEAELHVPQFSQRYPRYQITTGDSMELAFQFSPEFNQIVAVQPDGFISLRGVGELHIAGLTVPDATTAVAKAYSRILRDPAISLVLKDFDKPAFMVTGQVARPGKYELHGDTTVIQGVSMAGGFTSASKHSQVVLFRQVSSQWSEAKLLDVKKMLNSKQLAEDLHLRPGDMIYVPQNRLSKIKPFIPNSGLTYQLNPAQL